MLHKITKMIFSSVILLLVHVSASEVISPGTSSPTPSTFELTTETEPNSPTTQTSTDMTDPADTSESPTTTQHIIIQQTTMDDTNNTHTTTSQSTWEPQKSLLTMSESTISTDNSTETNSTISAQGDRELQDVAVNPGLIAVLCIFCIVVAAVVVVMTVKVVRSRRPQFERLDDVHMGKISEDAPFAHYPPK